MTKNPALLYLALIPLLRPTPLIRFTDFRTESRLIFLEKCTELLWGSFTYLHIGLFCYSQCNILNASPKHSFISKLHPFIDTIPSLVASQHCMNDLYCSQKYKINPIKKFSQIMKKRLLPHCLSLKVDTCAKMPQLPR